MSLRTISEQDLKNILDRHGKWLRNEEGGERADLRFANLSSADLSSADLSSADLSSANLSFANLSSANLLMFRFNRDQAYFTLDGTLRIGCIVMPISEWLLGFEEIGKKHEYSKSEIMAYGDFIKSCARVFEAEAQK